MTWGSRAILGATARLFACRGGTLAEEFGSVTRRFPWSVIAIEALLPMVFIHRRGIIMVPGHQHLLGFLAPLFESHRRLVGCSRLWRSCFEPRSNRAFPWLKVRSFVHEFSPFSPAQLRYRTISAVTLEPLKGRNDPLLSPPKRTEVDRQGSGSSRSLLRAKTSPKDLIEMGADTTAK